MGKSEADQGFTNQEEIPLVGTSIRGFQTLARRIYILQHLLAIVPVGLKTPLLHQIPQIGNWCCRYLFLRILEPGLSSR